MHWPSIRGCFRPGSGRRRCAAAVDVAMLVVSKKGHRGHAHVAHASEHGFASAFPDSVRSDAGVQQELFPRRMLSSPMRVQLWKASLAAARLSKRPRMHRRRRSPDSPSPQAGPTAPPRRRRRARCTWRWLRPTAGARCTTTPAGTATCSRSQPAARSSALGAARTAAAWLGRARGAEGRS